MQNSLLKTLTALLLLLGWTISASAAFPNSADINGSLPAGSVVDNGGGSYSVTGGGNDIWDATDQFFYAYDSVAGDFDVRVRVDTLTPANNWTKAGIMVRESLNHDSRMVFNRVTPTLAPGVNDTRLAYRTQTGADGAHEDGGGQASLPNGWLRLVRSGNTFTGYRSINGSTWILQQTLNTATWLAGAMPANVFLGLGVTSHAQGTPATAEFRNYQNLAGPALESATAPTGVPFYFDVLFSKSINATDAQTLANYNLPGVALLSATLLPDGKTVRITCNRLNLPGCRTLTVNNIKDLAGNTIAASSTVAVVYADGAMRYRRYDGIGGGNVSDLTGNAAFPNSPTAGQDKFVFQMENPEGNANTVDNSGSFFDGKLTVPVSGNYQFHISSDDESRLWLSTDENPASKVLIAIDPSWHAYRHYNGDGEGGNRNNVTFLSQLPAGTTSANVSVPIPLVAGCRYHIEYIYKEGGGGDFGSVAWRMPGDAAPADGSAPIPAQFLSINNGVGVTIGAAAPANTTVPAGSSANFSVAVTAGTPAINYQWYRNSGSGFAPIPGANSSSYTIPATALSDSGSAFFAIVVNPLNVVTSRVATLTVTSDLIRPKLDAAWVGNGNSTIYLQFSEPMGPTNATDQFAYTLIAGAPGITVSSAVQQPGGSNVILTTSALLPPGVVTLRITGVDDLGLGAPVPNVINPNPTDTNLTVGPLLTCIPGVIQRERFNGLTPGANVLATLLNNPKWPSSPDVIDFIPNTLGDCCDTGSDFGLRYAGHIIPTVSGNYAFEMHQDDSGRLRGSPDSEANNAVTLINIDGSCCGYYPITNIPLLQGKAYYFDGIMQEGGGGDYLEIRWKPPGTATFVPIPSANLAFCYAMNINAQPVDKTVEQNASATFTVGTTRAGAAQAPGETLYQWERSDDNGATWAPITGATGPSYTQSPSRFPEENGALFRAIVKVAGVDASTQTSAAAKLNVIPDVTPPTVVQVVCRLGLDGFTLTYSELMNPDTAGDQFSYQINDGVNALFYPTSVITNADARTIILVFPQTAGSSYTIIIDSASDLVGNAIAHTEIPVSSCLQSCAPGLTFQTYAGGGVAVANLTSNPNYPNNPDSVRIMNSFDTRAELGTDNFRDNYGARLRGVFVPPASGNYIFYLHSDDASQLFLNPTGPTAAGKVMIAQETGCCRDWPTIASAAIPLVQGKAYYIEGLYQEGGGGDYMRVAARIQGSADPLVAIPLSQLGQTFRPDSNVPAPIFTTQPQSQTITQNDSVSFSVAVTSDYGFTRQWQMKNVGGEWMDIVGANGPTYGYGPVPLSDDDKCFRVKICSIGEPAYSNPACLDVPLDTFLPVLTEVLCGPALDRWTLVFSEFVEENSAEDAQFGYAVNGVQLPAGAVTLNADGKSVTLLYGPQTENTVYTLSVNDVTDLAGNIMTPVVNRQILSCVAGCNPSLKFEAYDTSATDGGGVAISLLTGSPNFPNNPRDVARIQGFDSRLAYPGNEHERYGGRMSGLFFPRETGPHTFYLAADDNAELWLSTTMSPANKVRIASENVWSADRQWTASAGGSSVPNKKSAPIYLVAGRAYYMEGLWKEGGGGDHCSAAVQSPSDAGPPANEQANSVIPISMLGASAPYGILGTFGFDCQPQSTKVCLVLPAATGALDENFDAGNGGFTVVSSARIDQPWSYDAGSGTWRAGQNDRLADSSLVGPYLTTVGGPVSLSLTHRHSFEGGNYDGGQVQISVNGGPYTAVPGAAFTANGYSGNVVGTGPLNGQAAFVNDSTDYGSGTHITSTASLGSYSAGVVIRVRFLAAYDDCCFQGQPSWEITSVNVNGAAAGQQAATFTVCPTSSQGTPFRIQWEKRVGAGAFAPIPGETSPTLSFVPCSTDNGTCYRAQLCMDVGAKATSDTACLTVTQPNTPPSFVCGTNQVVAEDSGLHTIPGWAGTVTPDSIPALAGGVFNADFSSPPPVQGPSPYTANFNSGSLPPFTFSSGTQPPFVEPGGALRMSEFQVTGQQNFWSIPSLVPLHVDEFHASWKSRLAGAGQADGYSFNVGQGLGAFNFGISEEGTTAGLSVCVDTFDNGDVQPGGEIGVDIKWNGMQLGFTQAAAAGAHGPPSLMKDVFVNAAVDVDVLGNVTFTYDNFVVMGVIPGYTGIDIDQYLFAARTGGAAERCYIDDVSISAPPFQPGVVLPPAGSAFYGNTYQAGGVLHLTDAANGQQGSIIIEDLLGGARLGSFTMTFDALLGQGTTPPADGIGVSIANNLPNASFGEEGAGTGLTVSFDSFDNGGGEAPAIDVFYNGAVVAHTLVPGGLETGGQFVPVSIRLDADGTLDVNVAGNPVYSNLPTGYVPIAGARYGIGGRTGGLNEKNWIDNLHLAATAADPGALEAGQAVTFHVTNSCPNLFSVQPAISPDGTLTYTPAANACGSCTISVYATDNGGTDGQCGGNDRSETCTFFIGVFPVNDCPVAGSQSVSVNEGGMVAIGLVYGDVDALNGCGNTNLTVSIVVPPSHGTLSGSFPNLRYTPTNCYPGPCGHAAGPDAFSYQVWDGLCSVTGVVSITVIDVNKCPTPVPVITPKCILPAMDGEIQVYISPNNSNTCLIFDGMLSSDPDCDTLTYSWTVNGNVFSTAMQVTNCLPVGQHEIRLTVDDGNCDEGASIFINVITACEAIEALMTDIDANSSMTTSTTGQHGSTSKAEKESRKCRRPLLSSLKSACKAFDRNKFKEGLKKLREFQNKLRECRKKGYVVEAARWWAAAEVIIDSIECGQELHEKTHSTRSNDNHSDDDNDDTTKPWSNSHTPTHNPKTDKHWRSHEHHSHD